MTALVENLRALARHEHSDFTVAAEAADEIMRQRAIIKAEMLHWMKEASKHKRESGQRSDCAERDLERAKVAQRIIERINAAFAKRFCAECDFSTHDQDVTACPNCGGSVA